MSTRRQIIEAIIAALETIGDIDHVVYGMAVLGEKNVAAIVPNVDDFSRSSKLTKRGALMFAIRTIVPEMHQQALYEYEDLAPQIKSAMAADKTWGGLAYDTILQSEKWLYPDSEHADTGVDINYLVEYKAEDSFS